VRVRVLLMILIPKHRKAARKGSGRTARGVSKREPRVKREASPDARLITQNNASPVLLKRTGSCQSVASTMSTESAQSSVPDSIVEQDCRPRV
jgi:hypothetical protein